MTVLASQQCRAAVNRLLMPPAAQSMRPIARALRVFAHAENLPIIMHCIHGKDRTGLIIALLLLLLGVDEPTVVLDYAKSELELKVRACLALSTGDISTRHADVMHL
jgi:protein-tyrosine phosphatase